MVFCGNKQIKQIYSGLTEVKSVWNGSKQVWVKEEPVTYAPLCFTAEEANSTLKLVKGKNITDVVLKCSTDGEVWEDFVFGQDYTLANVGDKLYLKSGGSTTFSIGVSYTRDLLYFAMTGKIAASGSVQYLIDPEGKRKDVEPNCFAKLFYYCNAVLTTAPQLPATQLADSCYSTMFQNCTSLTVVPELPAKIPAAGCYAQMFNGCSGITEVPEFKFSTLANSCIYGMYAGTSIEKAPSLPWTTLPDSCYRGLFQNCTQLVEPPELPATAIVEGSTSHYWSMFQGCTSLTKAPTIHLTNIGSGGCNNMFSGCTSLKVAEDSGTGTLIYSFPADKDVNAAGMFTDTAGTFTGWPTAGHAYYCYE